MKRKIEKVRVEFSWHDLFLLKEIVRRSRLASSYNVSSKLEKAFAKIDLKIRKKENK